jgi:hypothetical protein
MTTKYKIIGKKTKPIPKKKLGYYYAPEESVRLVEDIAILQCALELLWKLSDRTIYDDGNESGQTMRRVHWILQACLNKARDELRYNYFSDPPIKPRQQPPTMTQLWLDIIADINAWSDEHKPPAETSGQA